MTKTTAADAAAGGSEGSCPECGGAFALTHGGRVRWHLGGRTGAIKRRPCPGTGELPGTGKLAPLVYEVRERVHNVGPAVTYTLTSGRARQTPAFRLTIETTRAALHDTWPLRHAIAQHAGVHPSQVYPDWDADRTRREARRIAPRTWLVQDDPRAAPLRPLTTSIEWPPYGVGSAQPADPEKNPTKESGS